MAITNKQRELRRNHIGASDSPVIVGVSPYQATLADIWHSKMGVDPDLPTEAMATGDRLEGPIVKFVAQALGCEANRANLSRVSKGRDNGVMAANLDGWLNDRPDEAIEAKYVGPAGIEYWGEPETAQVPDHVMIQCQHQMYVCDLKRIHVGAAMATPWQLRWARFIVERDGELIDFIVERAMDFWERFVVPKVCPEDSAPCMDILKIMHRGPGKIVPVEASLVNQWDSLRQMRLGVENAEKASLRLLLTSLGDAEGGDYGDDGKLFTYTSQKGAPHADFDALKADGLYDKYVTQGKHRTARLKKKGR